MPAKHSIWMPLFSEKAFPGLPCPNCDNGKMKLIKGSLNREEPKFSTLHHGHPDWEMEWVVQRFVARMRCDEETCGELIMLMGDTEIVQSHDDDYGWQYEEALRLRGVFPASPIFKVPEKVPHDVKTQIQLSFQIYWADLSTSLSRIRMAVELVMDDRGIPREKIGSKGKTIRMDLAERIDSFASSAKGADSKEALHGLRYIGNLGVHSADVSFEQYFDAVDVLEDVILGIYEKNSIINKIKKLKPKNK